MPNMLTLTTLPHNYLGRGKFLTKLVTERELGSKLNTLVTVLCYRDSLGRLHVAPNGFQTNFASIPSGLKFYLDDNAPEIEEPSVIHDFVYTVGAISREECDLLLLEMMMTVIDIMPEYDGKWPIIKYRKATSAYAGVRAGGGSHYAKK